MGHYAPNLETAQLLIHANATKGKPVKTVIKIIDYCIYLLGMVLEDTQRMEN
jgi:hypothetical protein